MGEKQMCARHAVFRLNDEPAFRPTARRSLDPSSEEV